MHEISNAVAVLLAGGSGTRLWPVSRKLFPKQLVPFLGEDSLVQRTVKRLAPILGTDQIRIVCGREHRHEIARHMSEVGVSAAGSILTEPCGRNTAPAVLLAVLELVKEGRDPVACVFPADHVIGREDRFHQMLRSAVSLAAAGRIVTFGIRPHYPETGYGYIEGGERLDAGGLAIRRFVEKPDLQTAQTYLDAGNFFWNSGMFAFRASVVVEEFSRHCPDLLAGMQQIVSAGGPVKEEDYRRLPELSFDHAIMEKTDRGAVLPSEFGWSDIGSWKSLFDFLPKDGDGNVIDGNVVTRETRDSFVMGYERLIAVNRLQHVVVVETPDSVFVSDLEQSRDVKEIVDRLKEQGRREVQHHRTVHAPWGRRTELEAKSDYILERLSISPGQRVELASGRGRIQHLIVLRGNGLLSSGAGRRTLNAGDNAVIAEDEAGALQNDQEGALTVLRAECPY